MALNLLTSQTRTEYFVHVENTFLFANETCVECMIDVADANDADVVGGKVERALGRAVLAIEGIDYKHHSANVSNARGSKLVPRQVSRVRAVPPQHAPLNVLSCYIDISQRCTHEERARVLRTAHGVPAPDGRAHCAFSDSTLPFFVARTALLRQLPFEARLKTQELRSFFVRLWLHQARVLTCPHVGVAAQHQRRGKKANSTAPPQCLTEGLLFRSIAPQLLGFNINYRSSKSCEKFPKSFQCFKNYN